MDDLNNFVGGIPDNPLMTIEIEEPAIGLKGWVCVHSLGKDGASGGIRCVGNVNKLEVQLLARAMTYKYAFFLAFLRVALKLDYVLITGSPQRGKLRSSRPLPDI